MIEQLRTPIMDTLKHNYCNPHVCALRVNQLIQLLLVLQDKNYIGSFYNSPLFKGGRLQSELFKPLLVCPLLVNTL